MEGALILCRAEGNSGPLETVAAELMRLKKEHERLTRDIASKERQLGDDTFRSRAPEKIISGLQGTLEERRIEIQKVAARIRELESGGWPLN